MSQISDERLLEIHKVVKNWRTGPITLETAEMAAIIDRLRAIEAERAALKAKLEQATRCIRAMTGTLEQCVMCPLCNMRHCPPDCDLLRAKKLLAEPQPDTVEGEK